LDAQGRSNVLYLLGILFRTASEKQYKLAEKHFKARYFNYQEQQANDTAFKESKTWFSVKLLASKKK
jgi:hypothetical protein